MKIMLVVFVYLRYAYHDDDQTSEQCMNHREPSLDGERVARTENGTRERHGIIFCVGFCNRSPRPSRGVVDVVDDPRFEAHFDFR